MAKRPGELPLHMRLDDRMSRGLKRAAEEETRDFHNQIRHYIRRGLTSDGYWPESQDLTEGIASPSEPDPDSN